VWNALAGRRGWQDRVVDGVKSVNLSAGSVFCLVSHAVLMLILMRTLIKNLGLIRMMLGILIVIDGLPLIFFVKETLHFASGSTVFTALVTALGFAMMIPFSIFRRYYQYNKLLMTLGVGSLLFMITYMLAYSGDLQGETGKDLIYYAYIFIFLLLLVTVPNDVLTVAIPLIILFTLVSNLALIYSLVKDPTWAVGQRAAIQYGEDETRSGNPHTFARNALMGLIACGIWMSRPQTDFLTRTVSGLLLVLNMIIVILTQTRTSVVALILMMLLFAYFNLSPVQIGRFFRGLLRPLPLTLIVVLVLSIPYIIRYNYSLYSLIAGYTEGFINKNLDNIYALLGQKASGAAYAATLDESAANRGTNAFFLSVILADHLEMLIFGLGYKSYYLDIPIAESLVTLGIFGFMLYSSFVAICGWLSLRAMRFNFNPMSTFLAYFFVYLFVLEFTGGRPGDMTFWHPFCLLIRFMGIETLLPARLWSSPADAERFGVSTPTDLVSQPLPA
jgi:hypothetical protein